MIIVERNGLVTFRVYLMHAENVELVGSFTDREHGHAWLNRAANGWWSICLHLPPGEHEFSYLVDDRFWVPDYAAAGLKRTPDGQLVSLLSMPPNEEAAKTAEVAAGRSAEGRDRKHKPSVARRSPLLSAGT